MAMDVGASAVVVGRGMRGGTSHRPGKALNSGWWAIEKNEVHTPLWGRDLAVVSVAGVPPEAWRICSQF
jgi:hypothetical protein